MDDFGLAQRRVIRNNPTFDVSGHVKLPIGGHGTAHWWPAELPTSFSPDRVVGGWGLFPGFDDGV